jgi:hypothetical protein
MFRTKSPAVLISGGKVLTYGRGDAINFNDTKSIEIYDPSTGLWSAPINQIQGTIGCQLEILNDNRIMTIGGLMGTNSSDFRCFFLGYTALSISKLSDKTNISIYPNPSTSFINITTNINNFGNLKIEIFNLLGELVYEYKGKITSIDVSGFKKGLYILNISDKNQIIHSEKIVIK